MDIFLRLKPLEGDSFFCVSWSLIPLVFAESVGAGGQVGSLFEIERAKKNGKTHLQTFF